MARLTTIHDRSSSRPNGFCFRQDLNRVAFVRWRPVRTTSSRHDCHFNGYGNQVTGRQVPCHLPIKYSFESTREKPRILNYKDVRVSEYSLFFAAALPGDRPAHCAD